MKTKLKTILSSFLAALALVVSGSMTTASAADPKPYPRNTCIVSGEELGSMGKPVTVVKDGQEFKLCCKGCMKKFEKNADQYVKELSTPEKK